MIELTRAQLNVLVFFAGIGLGYLLKSAYLRITEPTTSGVYQFGDYTVRMETPKTAKSKGRRPK